MLIQPIAASVKEGLHLAPQIHVIVVHILRIPVCILFSFFLSAFQVSCIKCLLNNCQPLNITQVRNSVVSKQRLI